MTTHFYDKVKRNRSSKSYLGSYTAGKSVTSKYNHSYNNSVAKEKAEVDDILQDIEDIDIKDTHSEIRPLGHPPIDPRNKTGRMSSTRNVHNDRGEPSSVLNSRDSRRGN